MIAIAGGLLLALGVFLTWYHLKTELTHLGSYKGPKDLSGWDVHTTMRFLLLAAAASPLILTYIVVRGHALSWPRGEMTAVTAIAAFGLIAYNGFITKPGNPRELIALQLGFYVSLVGSMLMLGGAATRSSETGRERKPPGTL
jgi:hypothetical protein